jgi:hypothetical protein
MLTRANDAGARYQAALETISDSIERTGSSAAQAWEGYRSRFDSVDEALGTALQTLQAALTEHTTALNGEVGRVDKALAASVDRLGGVVEPLTEYAGALDSYLTRAPVPAE